MFLNIQPLPVWRTTSITLKYFGSGNGDEEWVQDWVQLAKAMLDPQNEGWSAEWAVEPSRERGAVIGGIRHLN